MTHTGAPGSRNYFQTPAQLHQQIRNLQQELHQRDRKIQNQERIIQDLRMGEAERNRSLEDRLRRKIWDENSRKMEEEIKWRVRRELEEKLKSPDESIILPGSESESRFLDYEPESRSRTPEPTSDFDLINVPATFSRLTDKVDFANQKISDLESRLNRCSNWIHRFFKDNVSLVPHMMIHSKEELPKSVQADLRRLESISEDTEVQFGVRQVLREVKREQVQYVEQRRSQVGQIKREQSFSHSSFRELKEDVENLSQRVRDVKFQC